MTRIIIRGVPWRQGMIDYLARELPDAEWVIDTPADPKADNRGRATQSFLRALLLAGDGPAVLMEDDVTLCPAFRRKLEAEIAARPRNVIQFFSMRSADLTVGSRWDRKYMMSQCTYFPAGYCAQLAAYLPRWCASHPEDPGGYDVLVDQWLRERKEPFWIRCPSLVDHRVAASVMDRRRSSKRQARTFDTAP